MCKLPVIDATKIHQMQALNAGANVWKIYSECFDVSDCCCNPAQWCFGSRSLFITSKVKIWLWPLKISKDQICFAKHLQAYKSYRVTVAHLSLHSFWFLCKDRSGLKRKTRTEKTKNKHHQCLRCLSSCSMQLPSRQLPLLGGLSLVFHYSGRQLCPWGAPPRCNPLSLTEVVWNLLGRLFFLHRQIIAEDLPSCWVPTHGYLPWRKD